MKILVVDDKEEERYLASVLLKGCGFEVETAVNGKEALTKLRSQRFDLIVSDILMPVMDGFQLCLECKSDEKLKVIPFIFSTSTYKDESDEKLALKIGADRFIRKPIDADEFIKIVQDIVVAVEKGEIVWKKPVGQKEKEVFKLYNETLVRKLEKKMLELEAENAHCKVLQGELQESEKKFRNLVENVVIGIMVTLPDGQILSGNKAALAIFGFNSEEEFIRTSISAHYVVPEDRKHLMTLIQGKKGVINCETQMRRRDETPFWASLGIITQMVNGETQFLTTIEDITERKQAEIALKESEAKYSALVEHSNDGIIIIQDGLLTYANTRAIEITGFPLEEAIGKPFIDFVAPEDRNLVMERYQKRIAGESVPIRYEFNIFSKSGERIPVEVNASIIEYEGKPADMAIVRDITERKLAEKALKESEQFNTSLLENSPNPINVVDLDFSIRYGNPALEKLTGFSQAEIIGKKPPYPWWHEQVTEQAKEFENLFTQTHIVKRERTFQKKSGEPFWVELTSVIVRENDAPQYILTNWVDITERKKAEEAIGVSQIKYRVLFESLPEGVTVSDRDGNILESNRAAERLLGLSREEQTQRTIDGHNWRIIHLDGSPMPADEYASVRALKENRLIENVEMGIYKGENDITWINVTATPIPLEGYGVAITYHDITERKQAEKEIKQSLEKVSNAVGQTIQAMSNISEVRDPYTAGHQRRVAHLSVKIAQEMGLSKTQIDGIQMAAFIHDIGKIAVPSEILSKPGKLTSPEVEMIQRHSQVGHDILDAIDFPWPIAQIIQQHHERMDGSGYPGKLSGEQILLEARIIAVADVVEAMSSHRPYRPALGVEKGLLEINQKSGQLYDPVVANTCLNLFTYKGFKFE